MDMHIVHLLKWYLHHSGVCRMHACLRICVGQRVHFYHGAWDGHSSSGFLIKATRHLRRKVLWRDKEKKQRPCQYLDRVNLVLTKDEIRDP